MYICMCIRVHMCQTSMRCLKHVWDVSNIYDSAPSLKESPHELNVHDMYTCVTHVSHAKSTCTYACIYMHIHVHTCLWQHPEQPEPEGEYTSVQHACAQHVWRLHMSDVYTCQGEYTCVQHAWRLHMSSTCMTRDVYTYICMYIHVHMHVHECLRMNMSSATRGRASYMYDATSHLVCRPITRHHILELSHVICPILNESRRMSHIQWVISWR